MKNTKAKILETALLLFNEKGLSKVKLRTIAKEMGISQGNLNYHFKKRSDIIEALYFNLVELINKEMIKNEGEKPNLKLMFSLSDAIMKHFFAYRFFMLDFVQIMRENQVIKSHYLQLTALRESQFLLLFKALIQNDTMREEQLPNEYLFLYKRFQILGDFWISSATVVKTQLTQDTIQEYSKILGQAIYPYLTDKGKMEFIELNS